MRNIAVILFTILLISCHKRNEQVTKTNSTNTKTDSLENRDIDIKLFSVYNLSKATTAIVVNLDDSNSNNGNSFDKTFNQINANDSLYNVFETDTTKVRNFEYYDTLGSYKLIKNKALEIEIKKIIDDSYYVYGTKGFSKININNVVCGLDECRTNIIAFPIQNFDITKNGNPIFCSKQLLKITYQKNYSDIERKIQEYNEKESKNYDYKDEIKTTVFANLGDYYFTYNDDFLWGKFPEKTKCDFPGRAIYIVKKDKPIKVYWGDGLDLFGIPCD